MKRILNISVIFSLLIFYSCKVEQPVLDDSSQIAVEEDPEIGTPAAFYNKGVLEDFKGEIYSWWVGNDQLVKDKKGDTLIIKAKEVGPKYTPFGREFNIIDMKDAPVLKVRMRAEGANSPLVGISLKDVDGYDTNFDRPKNKIKVSNEYSDYYFNYSGKWKQGWPTPAKVNETTIHDILFFINPGGAEWSGTLFIDDIKFVSEADLPKQDVKVGGYIDDFSEGIESWWSGSGKVALDKNIDGGLLVIADEAGPAYETFGRAFDPTNFATGTQIIRLKAKALDNPADLRIDLKDNNGMVSNGTPVLNKIEVTPEFKDYFYNYDGKYLQYWPEAGVVNPEAIAGLLLFINPGGQPSAYTGKIVIKEIELINEKRMNELKPKQ